MSPLKVEVYHPYEAKWANLYQVPPGRQTDPLINVNSDGQRESIIFLCSEDDTSSTIFTFTKKPSGFRNFPASIEGNLGEVKMDALRKGQSILLEARDGENGRTKLLRVSQT